MAIPCDYCDKDIDKVVFCSDKCRKGYSRHGKTMSEKRTESVQNPDNRTKDVRNMDYDHLPNMLKPALSWRDDKGQCQHKLKACQLCQ